MQKQLNLRRVIFFIAPYKLGCSWNIFVKILMPAKSGLKYTNRWHLYKKQLGLRANLIFFLNFRIKYNFVKGTGIKRGFNYPVFP